MFIIDTKHEICRMERTEYNVLFFKTYCDAVNEQGVLPTLTLDGVCLTYESSILGNVTLGTRFGTNRRLDVKTFMCLKSYLSP